MQVLKIIDAAWLLAESHRTPMHVGMLATFAVPEDAGDCYLEDLVDRWRAVRHFQPPFNYVQGRGPVPHWRQVADERIDLDYHLRRTAVPSPGRERELGILVSRLHSHALDRRYPLWECHVIEGVARGRWSLYVKVHHSQIDGVGGIRLARRMLSVDPAARGMLPPWAVGTRGPDQSGAAREEADQRPEPESRNGGGPSLLGAARAVTGSLTRTYAESLTGYRTQRRAAPYQAPGSVFNTRINAPRRFATQSYEMERIRAVAKAGGGSINDVFLTACGGALRRYLLEMGALPDRSLTAIVPVSVRPEGAAKVGNALTFLYAELGTDVDDPVERFQVVRESIRLGKERVPEAGPGAMDAYTTALMGPYLGQAVLGVGGFGPPAANVVVSNVPGFSEDRYLDGSRLEAYYPLSLLFHGQALNITAVSSGDCFCIGYTGCRDTVPHLQRIALYSGDALEDLEKALG